MTASPEDRFALRDLAEGYAFAIDHHDRQAFEALFHEDASLVTFVGNDPGDEPRNTHTGHAALGRIVDVLATMYPRTFHLVGNHRCAVDGDSATGEAYCVAHHLTPDPFRHGATDYVMVIRYLDDYGRRDGVWRFTRRRMLLEWSGTYPVIGDEVHGGGGLAAWHALSTG